MSKIERLNPKRETEFRIGLVETANVNEIIQTLNIPDVSLSSMIFQESFCRKVYWEEVGRNGGRKYRSMTLNSAMQPEGIQTIARIKLKHGETSKRGNGIVDKDESSTVVDNRAMDGDEKIIYSVLENFNIIPGGDIFVSPTFRKARSARHGQTDSGVLIELAGDDCEIISNSSGISGSLRVIEVEQILEHDMEPSIEELKRLRSGLTESLRAQNTAISDIHEVSKSKWMRNVLISSGHLRP